MSAVNTNNNSKFSRGFHGVRNIRDTGGGSHCHKHKFREGRRVVFHMGGSQGKNMDTDRAAAL